MAAGLLALVLASGAPLPSKAAEGAGGVAMLALEGETRIAVELPAPAPLRSFAVDAPPRLVIDFGAGSLGDFAAWPDHAAAARPVGLVGGIRAGLAGGGRLRLVFDLNVPAAIVRADLVRLPDGRAQYRLSLAPAPAGTATRGWPAGTRAPAPPAHARAPADPRPVAMIDPGHGGVDPGAQRGGLVEKDLALDFARDLAAALEAGGVWRPALTRDGDVTLGLREQVALAEAAGAAVLVSLHANVVERGDASGATVYTLSDIPSDPLGAALAAHENRADIVAGVDLGADGDDVAAALTELGRRGARAASRRLGDGLAAALAEVSPMLRDRAHEQAGFRVLTSPITPSALVELGFLGNADDAARLADPAWRARAAAALAAGLEAWRAADAPDAGTARLDTVTAGR